MVLLEFCSLWKNKIAENEREVKEGREGERERITFKHFPGKEDFLFPVPSSFFVNSIPLLKLPPEGWSTYYNHLHQ